MSKFKTLNEAADNGTTLDVVKYLIESGNPNELYDECEGYRTSALHTFAISGLVQFMEFLLSIKADPNVRDSDGQTPLHLAAERGQKEAVELLLDRGAKTDVQAYDGDTPLHRALVEKQNEIAKILINKGADVNIANNRGITPKQIAAFNVFD